MNNWHKVNSYAIGGLEMEQLIPFNLVWVSNDTFDFSYRNNWLRTDRFSVSKPNPVAVSESPGFAGTRQLCRALRPDSALSLGENNLFMGHYIVFVQNRQTGSLISKVFCLDQRKSHYEYVYSDIGISGDSQLFCVETQTGIGVTTFNVYVSQKDSVNKFDFSALDVSNIHRAIPSLKDGINRKAHFTAKLTSISLHPRIPNLAAVTIDAILRRRNLACEKRGVAAIINLKTKESQFLGWDVKAIAFSSTGRYLVTSQAERMTSFTIDDSGKVAFKKYRLNPTVLALTPDPNTDEIFGICDGDVVLLNPKQAYCRYLFAHEELSAASTGAGREDVIRQKISFSPGGDYFAVSLKKLGIKSSIHIDVFKRSSRPLIKRRVYTKGDWYHYG